MRVCIFVNHVVNGWLATDLNKFLGGSEECVVLLAEALVRKGYYVTVYHNMPSNRNIDHYYKAGVEYVDRKLISVNTDDILITFKDKLPWLAKETNVSVKIHWSSEVEIPWDVSILDYFVHLTSYHRYQHLFVPDNKNVIVPHGIDTELLFDEQVKKEKDFNLMLYCSSPDRGLLQLLSDWGKIKSNFPELKLVITYGFSDIMSMRMSHLKQSIEGLSRQKDITFLGRVPKKELYELYHKAGYWCLPLNNPQSELFCLNALKSRLCNCIAVVNRIGALRHTVADYVPYSAFVSGNNSVINDSDEIVFPHSWDYIVERYWIPMFNKTLIEEAI